MLLLLIRAALQVSYSRGRWPFSNTDRSEIVSSAESAIAARRSTHVSSAPGNQARLRETALYSRCAVNVRGERAADWRIRIRAGKLSGPNSQSDARPGYGGGSSLLITIQKLSNLYGNVRSIANAGAEMAGQRRCTDRRGPVERFPLAAEPDEHFNLKERFCCRFAVDALTTNKRLIIDATAGCSRVGPGDT